MLFTKYGFLFLFLLTITRLHSQSSIGFDMEINRDFFGIKDEGSRLQQSTRVNVSPGFVYRYTFRNKIAIYSGLRLKYYTESVTFNKSIGTFNGSVNPSAVIPLLLGRNFNIYRAKFFISPLLGAGFNVFFINSVSNVGGSLRTLKDSISFTSSEGNSTSAFITGKLGLSAEYKFTEGFSLAVFFQYTKGFGVVSQQMLVYRVNGGSDINASQTNYGTYTTYLGFKLFYTLSKRQKAAS